MPDPFPLNETALQAARSWVAGLTIHADDGRYERALISTYLRKARFETHGGIVAGRTKTEGRRIGAIFALRLREAREARGWRQQDLSDRMGQLGAPMDRTTLAKIERGKREARLEEMIALAAALDVAPLNLYMPIEGDEPVCLAPALAVDPGDARKWARGFRPLDPTNHRVYQFQSPGGPESSKDLEKDEREAMETALDTGPHWTGGGCEEEFRAGWLAAKAFFEARLQAKEEGT